MAGTSAAAQDVNQDSMNRSVAALGKILGAIGVGGKEGLADVGVAIFNGVTRNLSTPGKGRIYRRPGVRGPRAVIHRASAPGQPPAVDTGLYRSSWSWRPGHDVSGDYVEIGTNDKRGPWLEYGTRRMQPRPHLRPVMQAMRSDISRMIRDGIVAKQTEEIRRLPKEIE